MFYLYNLSHYLSMNKFLKYISLKMVSVHVYDCNILMMPVAPDLEVTDLPANGG